MKELDVTEFTARTLLSACPSALLVLAADGRIRALNPALLELTGSAAEDLEGRNAAELGGSLGILLSQQGPIAWTRPDGEPRSLVIQVIALEDGGEARWFTDTSRTESLRERCEHLQEELRAHSLTDEVTGLLNQRGLMLALEPQVARSRRYNSAMAVIMMEACAERASDALQVSVSRLLKDQLRWADIIGCTDRHEFILVLPETSRADALKLADKLSGHLQDLRSPDGQQAWTCYGVTEWQKSDSAATLLRRAATALEQSRNEHKGMAVAL